MVARDETSDQIANQQEFDATELAETGTAAYQKFTVAGTAITFPALPTDAHKAIIVVEGADVRYRLDGDVTAPTATDGMLLVAGTTTVMVGVSSRVKFIRTGGVSATLHCTFFA